MNQEKRRKSDKLWTSIKQNPLVSYLVIGIGSGVAGAIIFCLDALSGRYESILGMMLSGFVVAGLIGVFLIYPVILSFVNLVGIFIAPKEKEHRRIERRFEIFTIVLGVIYTFLFLTISNVQVNARWFEQLYNSQIHQPIWTDAAPTVIFLSVVGVIGYLILSGIRLNKLPPLVTILSMSAMYLGIVECILWSVQTIGGEYWVLSVFPVNCVLIGFKTIRYKIFEWNRREDEDVNAYPEKPILNVINNILGKAELWPLFAFVLMWPLLGILLGILILFGQKPDAIVKAWTETADWRLSQQIAPQNAMYDEHYLCTVAAGGHEKVVKPIRMGQRHGHRVVVNRQLCIANAFEQILEERTPKFHRAVRHFYDTYGFPVSRLIRTKGAADVVYIFMKPLEWIFLCVIYLCDAKPENRIAVQYLPFTKDVI